MFFFFSSQEKNKHVADSFFLVNNFLKEGKTRKEVETLFYMIGKDTAEEGSKCAILFNFIGNRRE